MPSTIELPKFFAKDWRGPYGSHWRSVVSRGVRKALGSRAPLNEAAAVAKALYALCDEPWRDGLKSLDPGEIRETLALAGIDATISLLDAARVNVGFRSVNIGIDKEAIWICAAGWFVQVSPERVAAKALTLMAKPFVEKRPGLV
jgi:hypothetical protein